VTYYLTVFQCCAESYRTKSKPTNNWHNLQQRKKETQLLAHADDVDIVGRSQSAVRDAYLALESDGNFFSVMQNYFQSCKKF
jgi:hypothetical protein